MYSLKDITVIINTFNSEDQIYSCLDTIDKSVNVIIIENSANNNFKRATELKYSNVNCELAQKNLGYGKGNNLGLSKVKTKFALILNPDAQLKNDTLNNFLETANNIKDFAIIGPGIQEASDTLKEKFGHNNLIETENVKGFAMFLNLQQFEEVGFFDENFFIYFEEIDLCKKLIKNEKKIFLDTSIKINHFGGTSHEESINYEMEKSRNWHWMWSKFYFHKKHNSYLYGIIYTFPNLISSILKFYIYKITKRNEKKIIYKMRILGLLNSYKLKKSYYRPFTEKKLR